MKIQLYVSHIVALLANITSGNNHWFIAYFISVFCCAVLTLLFFKFKYGMSIDELKEVMTPEKFNEEFRYNFVLIFMGFTFGFII